MKTDFLNFFLTVGLPLFGVAFGIIYKRKRNEGGAPSVVDTLPSVPDYSDDVWRILMTAYTKLRQGGVSVRSPWISGCIAEIDKGGDCPPDVAELAVWKTLRELPDGRYDVTYLGDAIAELQRLGA